MILFCIFLGLTILFLVWALRDPEVITGVIFFSFITASVSALPYYVQVSDWVEYENVDKKIANAENMRTDVLKQIKDTNIAPAQLMNADSPYSSLYSTYVSLEKEILEYKQEKVRLFSGIEKGERGIFSYWCLKARPEGVE